MNFQCLVEISKKKVKSGCEIKSKGINVGMRKVRMSDVNI